MLNAKNKKRVSAIAVWVCCGALLCSGCRKKATEEVDFGTIQDSVYTNQYFGLSIKFPEDWSALDYETQKELTSTGIKVAAGNDKNAKALLRASELQSINLFMVLENPMGSPVPFNPNILCVAEKVGHMPGIKRGKDYLYHAKKLIGTTQLKADFPEDFYTEEIAGQSFDVMSLEMKIPGMLVKQKHLCLVQKGYALDFIISYTTPEEEQVLMEILKTLSFSQ